jgi:hypothetical protein
MCDGLSSPMLRRGLVWPPGSRVERWLRVFLYAHVRSELRAAYVVFRFARNQEVRFVAHNTTVDDGAFGSAPVCIKNLRQ